MEFVIEIETTKKYTAGFITNSLGQREEARVETARDGLVSLLKCIEEGAQGHGLSASELLKRTKRLTLRVPEMITDTLEKQEGARVGLVVSKGQEEKVYYDSSSGNPVIGSIVSKEVILGIDEEMSVEGARLVKPSEEEVKDKVRHLLEFGAGIIVISLRNASYSPANETSVKEIIESDYPRHYLGAVPVLVASDFSDERNDSLRTNVCLANAYTWFKLNDYLRHVESLLQSCGYNHGLLTAYADGDAVHIHRVTPLKTCVSDQISFIKSLYG